MNPHMARALTLAERARGWSSPNPPVGAVLARDGVIVGEGWTRPPGGAHAEVEALRQAGERAAGAELHVTLEPCCVHGRTPPCTRAIMRAGVRAVHVACTDPNPLVDGRGARQLQEAGVEVHQGDGQAEATELIAGFARWITTGLPLVTAKYAMSVDGKIATAAGSSRWITGALAREDVHRLRREHDAILVGSGTALSDDPLLTVRLPGEDGADVWQPMRVVLDRRGRLPARARVLHAEREPRTLWVVGGARAEALVDVASGLGAELLPLGKAESDAESLRLVLIELGRRGVTSVLIEGGGGVLGAAFDARAIDRVVVYVGMKVVGGAGAPGPIGGVGVTDMATAPRLADTSWRQFGDDLRLSGRVIWEDDHV